MRCSFAVPIRNDPDAILHIEIPSRTAHSRNVGVNCLCRGGRSARANDDACTDITAAGIHANTCASSAAGTSNATSNATGTGSRDDACVKTGSGAHAAGAVFRTNANAALSCGGNARARADTHTSDGNAGASDRTRPSSHPSPGNRTRSGNASARSRGNASAARSAARGTTCPDRQSNGACSSTERERNRDAGRRHRR
jgi:hypothetical protein